VGKFFYSEVSRIETWHSERCSEVNYTSEEAEAGFPDIIKQFGWKAVLYSISQGNFEQQAYIENLPVYQVYFYLQYLSKKSKAEKDYQEIIQRRYK
jgi:hypothetical protein